MARAGSSAEGTKTEAMIDSKGRKIDYLRISVTDRCNLRCVYCMPPHGVESICHSQVMRFEEILRICRIISTLGITKLKITGGEPLVRRGVIDFIREAKAIDGIEQVTLTTNGILLTEYMSQLIDIGIDGINISLDSLDPKRYKKIVRIGELEDVLAGLKAALASDIRPIKINSVLLRGVNDHEAADLAALARDNHLSVRFIELMPIGLGKTYQPVPGQEVLERLTKAYGKATDYPENLGNGPAKYYTFPGFKGQIGLIDAISHCFCATCNRIRLTSEGKLKLCLHYDHSCDLLDMIAKDATDQQIKEAIIKAVEQKPDQHHLENNEHNHRENNNMHTIGG